MEEHNDIAIPNIHPEVRKVDMKLNLGFHSRDANHFRQPRSLSPKGPEAS